MKAPILLILGAVLIALSVVFFLTRRPESSTPEEPPRHFVWKVESLELQHMTIDLPHASKKQSWFKDEDRFWYFDEPDGPKVDMDRWGGGIPLLLSGPGVNRLISDQATTEQLAMYGLEDPHMLIELLLETKETLSVEVGYRTLDGTAYYIKMADSLQVYTVDSTWYQVLAGLVLDPPYPPISR
jgi:hypothetical protein